MKFSFEIPLGDIAPGEFQTGEAVTEMAGALESAGIDACFVTDHPAPDAEWLHTNGHDTLDPFTALAFVAAATKRLMVHTNIYVLPYRNPFLSAKGAASLQVLSGGRLIFGVGGGYQRAEFDALGVDFGQRGKLFNEAIEVIREVWSGGPVARAGSAYRFNATGNEPRPVPAPPPPIWIGGASDRAVERAARHGDGWNPIFSAPYMSKINRDTGLHSVEHLAEKIARLRDLRAGLGRTGPFDIAIGPQRRPRYLTAEGAQQYLDALGELAAVGVNWSTIIPPKRSRQQFIESVTWFGEEVVRRL